jgi:hypothetical protein
MVDFVVVGVWPACRHAGFSATRGGIVLGHKAHLLHERLKHAESFVRRYGNHFQINLIAIAYCPADSAFNATHPLSLRFTLSNRVLQWEPTEHSILVDGAQSVHASVYEQQSGYHGDTTDLLHPPEAVQTDPAVLLVEHNRPGVSRRDSSNTHPIIVSSTQGLLALRRTGWYTPSPRTLRSL